MKLAGEWQAELRSGQGGSKSRMTWSDFRDDFEGNYLNHLSMGYQNNVCATFNLVEDLMRPDKLQRINREWLKLFRKNVSSRPSATIHKYFQHIKTAMNWAHEQGYITSVPVFPKQEKGAAKAKKHMKGRPITAEEFDRIIAAIPKSFPKYKNPERMQEKVAAGVDSLEYLLNGLWLSGLRLGEALSLTWDQWADGIRIQIDGGDLFLLIDSEDQKNRETEQYPVVDSFAEFLLATPEEQRTGHVFKPKRSGNVSRRVDTVSEWIVKIGEQARVKVDEKNGNPLNTEPPVRFELTTYALRNLVGDRRPRKYWRFPPFIVHNGPHKTLRGCRGVVFFLAGSLNFSRAQPMRSTSKDASGPVGIYRAVRVN